MIYAETKIRHYNFEIQTDHLIPARRPNLVIIKKKKNKENCQRVNFSVPAGHRVKLKESKKRDKYMNLTKELKKTMKHEVAGDTNSIWCTRKDPQGLFKVAERFENWRTSRDYSHYSIVKIGQITEKSPGNLRRLNLAQTPVKNQQVTLV